MIDDWEEDEETQWHGAFDPATKNQIAWLDRCALLLGIEEPQPTPEDTIQNKAPTE